MGGWGFILRHILILQYGKCSHVVLNGTNEGHIKETASVSLKGFLSAPAGFFSFILYRLFVLKILTDSNDEDPFSREVSCGHEVHGVLCEASLLCSGRVMQAAIYKGEMAPDKLITTSIFFRKNSPGLLCPPQLDLTKGHLVSVQDLFENYLNHRDEQGQYFTKTKNP